jgi:hypothetical protein
MRTLKTNSKKEQGGVMMKFHPQLKVLALSVGMALASGSAYAGAWGAPTHGDSGADVNTVMANSLTPRGLQSVAAKDGEGLGPYRVPVSHTPSGQMYGVPYAVADSDSPIAASIELGYLGTGGDDNAQKFREYTDYRDGLIINSFSVSGEGKDHTYFHVYGGGVARDDQYYAGAVGRYNDWRLSGFYNETVHNFSTTARPIWDGVGTDRLVLKNLPGINLGSVTSTTGLNATTLTPNVADNDVIDLVRATILGTEETDIGLKRQKTGLRFDKTITPDVNVFINANFEKRKGARPFGLAPNGFGGAGDNPTTTINNGNNNGPLDPPEPVNYQTTEIQAGFGWVIDELSTLTGRVEVSLFRDEYKFVTVEDPYLVPFPTANNTLANKHTLSFSTPPDNESYSVKLGYARSFPNLWKSELTINGSLTRQTQDDNLVPYTSVTGAGLGGNNNPANAITNIQGSGVNPSLAAYWNNVIGPNGVPTVTRLTSDLSNDITMLNLGWSMQPTDDLSLNAKVRLYEKDDDNTYVACNPSIAADLQASGVYTGTVDCDPAVGGAARLTATGALPTIYGYAFEDGFSIGLGSMYAVGNGGGVRGRSFSGSFKENTFSLGGDYQINRSMSASLAYEREDVYRKMRERDWTNEDKIKVGFVDRSLFGGSLRASYEYGKRRGDDWKAFGYIQACAAYNVDPDGCWLNAFSSSTGAAPVGGINAGPLPITTAVGIGNVVSESTARAPEGQKHDLADRDRNVLVMRYNSMLTNTLDFMVTGRISREKFPDRSAVQSGRDEQNDSTVSVDLTWQPSTSTNVYGTLTWQKSELSANSMRLGGAANSTCTLQNMIDGNCNALIGAPGNIIPNSTFGNVTAANNSVYQSATHEDDNKMLLLGISHNAGSVFLDASYSYLKTETDMKWGLQTNNGIGGTSVFSYTGGAASGLAQLPTQVYDRQTLNLSATIPVDDKIAVRGMYTYDKTDFADWHYNFMDPNNPASAVSGQRIYLDTGAQQPYTAHVFGLMLQYKL